MHGGWEQGSHQFCTDNNSVELKKTFVVVLLGTENEAGFGQYGTCWHIDYDHFRRPKG